MSVIHTVKVRNRFLTVSNNPVTQGSNGVDMIDLDLDSEWDGLKPTIILGTGDSALKARYAGKPIEIPSELLREPGWVPVAVVGENRGRTITTRFTRYGILVVKGGAWSNG